MNNNL